MPSRVVRGEINRSESLSNVSLGAELTFRALILECDDYGRFDARAKVLKAALFSMRDEISREQVLAWVQELAADGCVRLYENSGRPYLVLPGWENHRGKGRRGTQSKFPEPPIDRDGDHEGDSTASEGSEIPRESRESEDSSGIRGSHGDPPVGRGSRDEGRGTRVDQKSRTPSGGDSVEVDGSNGKARKPRGLVPGAAEIRDALATAIRVCSPDHRFSVGFKQAWDREADLMIRRDGRKVLDVLNTIDWLFGANQQAEARFEVFSMRSLRKKFDAIQRQRLKAYRDETPAAGAGGDFMQHWKQGA